MKSRVLTALGLIPIVLGTLFCASPWPIVCLGLVVVCLCAKEESALVRFQVLPPCVLLYGAGIAGLLLKAATPGYVAIGAALFVAGCFAAYGRTKSQSNAAAGVLSSLWIVCPVLALVFLHQQGHGNGSWNLSSPVLMAVVPLWGGDTAAYFVGKSFGKRLLAPKISPKKTIEGGIANVLACLLVASLLGPHLGFVLPISCAVGLAAGVLGQAGDLFESHLKRQAGVKDSGSILPGHGGMLDRIDSILFTAPFVALLLSLHF